jgi:tetratricopeptide (TPR) repeat protein
VQDVRQHDHGESQELALAQAGFLRTLGPRTVLIRDGAGLPVVLKQVPAQASARDCLEFRLEAWRASQLKHPHLVAVDEHGFTHERPCYVMPFIASEEARVVPSSQRLSVLRDLLRALAVIHAKGWVHAGIAPAAVRLGAAGVMLLGYGTLSVSGCAARGGGELSYASPEQLAGLTLDARSDLYRVGALLRTWVLGESVLERERLRDWPDPMAILAYHLLAPDREARPASVAVVLAMLDRMVGDVEPIVTVPDGLTRVVSIKQPTGERWFEGALTRARRGQTVIHTWTAEAGAGKRHSLRQWMAAALGVGVPVLWMVAQGAEASPLAAWRALMASGLRGVQANPVTDCLKREVLEGLESQEGWFAWRIDGWQVASRAARLRAWLEVVARPCAVWLIPAWNDLDEASQRLFEAVLPLLDGLGIVVVVAGTEVVLPGIAPLDAPVWGPEDWVALAQGLVGAPLLGVEPAVLAQKALTPGYVTQLLRLWQRQGLLEAREGQLVLPPDAEWPATQERLAWAIAHSLGGSAWAVAAVVSVLHPCASAGHLEAMFQDKTMLVTGLDALVGAGVLDEGPLGYHFSSPDYVAIYAASMPEEQAILVQEALFGLYQAGQLQMDVAAVARLAITAEHPEWVAAAALTAARQALGAGAWGRARWFLEEGLATLPPETASQFGFLVCLAELERLAGAWSRADACLQAAEVLLNEVSEQERLEWYCCKARVAEAQGAFADALAAFEAALVWADEHRNPAARALIECGIAAHASWSGQFWKAQAHALGALARLGALGTALRARVLRVAGLTLVRGSREQHAQGVIFLQQARGLAEGLGDRTELLRLRLALLEAHCLSGVGAQQRSEALALLDLTRHTGSPVMHMWALQLALVVMPDDTERLDAAIQWADTHGFGVEQLELRARAVLQRIHAGQVSGFLPTLREVAKQSEALTASRAQVRVGLLCVEAWLLCEHGPVAAGILQALNGPLSELNCSAATAHAAYWRGVWARRCGDHVSARLAWQTVVGEVDRTLAAKAMVELGQLASLDGRAIEAHGWYEQARRAAEADTITHVLAQLDALAKAPEPSASDTVQRLKELEATLTQAQRLLASVGEPVAAQLELTSALAVAQRLNRLWEALIVCEDVVMAARALTKALFEVCDAYQIFVLGPNLAPWVAQARDIGDLPYSSALIEREWCVRSLNSQQAVRESAGRVLVLPLCEQEQPVGVVFLVSDRRVLAPSDALWSLIRAASRAIRHLDRPIGSLDL